jgi:hypothetical protein
MVLVNDLTGRICADKEIRMMIALQQPEDRPDHFDHLIGVLRLEPANYRLLISAGRRPGKIFGKPVVVSRHPSDVMNTASFSAFLQIFSKLLPPVLASQGYRELFQSP